MYCCTSYKFTGIFFILAHFVEILLEIWYYNRFVQFQNFVNCYKFIVLTYIPSSLLKVKNKIFGKLWISSSFMAELNIGLKLYIFIHFLFLFHLQWLNYSCFADKFKCVLCLMNLKSECLKISREPGNDMTWMLKCLLKLIPLRWSFLLYKSIWYYLPGGYFQNHAQSKIIESCKTVFSSFIWLFYK
jgi:hypothetical protein